MEWEYRQATEDEYQRMHPLHQHWYDNGIGLKLCLLDTGEIVSTIPNGTQQRVPSNTIALLRKTFVPGHTWSWCGLTWRIDDNHHVQQVPTTAIAAGAMAA